MKRPQRLWWLWLLAVLASMAVLALAACGDEEEEGAGETPTAAAGERMEGGELTVQQVEFASLDPHFSSFAQDISLHRMIWRGLYTLDIDNVPQPAMADAQPEVSSDSKVYTVKLKDGLLWSDGDDLKAEDFVAGIIRTCNPVNAGEYQYVLTNIVGCDDYYNSLAGPDGESDTADDLDAASAEVAALEEAVGVTAVDELTIEFQLNEPQATFPIILSLWMTFPVPVHIDRFASATPDTPGDWGTDAAALAYNGPYMLTAYSPQESVTLEPNPNWAAPAGVSPTLDKLTLRFIDDLAVAANAYRTGEVSETDTDLTQLESLVAEFGDGVEYFKFLGPSTRGLEMQMTAEPLDDLDVRLAISQAIDRETLNTAVMQGAHVPSTSWIPEITPAWRDAGGPAPDAFEAEIGYNPESAKQHLTDAGYPNGEGFPTLTILVSDVPQNIATAEFLQENLKTILNIDTEIETVDGPTRAQRFTDQQFELYPGGWVQDYPDPENWVLGLFDTGGSLNNYNCSDPDIDDLVEKARFNTNDDERLKQYAEINELISTRACGIAVYYHENNHWLIKPNVVGMRESMSGQDGSIAGDWNAEAWGLAAE